jgi:antirestriction protein ArdC
MTVVKVTSPKRAIVTAAAKAQSAADYLHGLQASKECEAA